MNLESKIKIFESGIKEGIFSRNKKFYPSNFTKSDITEQFLKVKDKVAKTFNFDSHKIFQAYQKTEKNGINYPDGKYVVLDSKYMQNDDFWFEKIETDILIISDKYPGIVVGNQMADCPILIVEDRKLGVTALSHCGASYIDRLLPKQTVESLIKEYNSNIEDLYVYVGSCAKKLSYIYDKYPYWAKNKELWKDNISLEKDGYHINMNGAIKKQLKELGICHLQESPINTVTDNSYYSHIASSKNKNKFGQNFVGFFYK